MGKTKRPKGQKPNSNRRQNGQNRGYNPRSADQRRDVVPNINRQSRDRPTAIAGVAPIQRRNLSGSLVGRTVDGQRTMGTPTYLLNDCCLLASFWAAGGRFAVKARGYFNEVARANGATRLDDDSRIKLSNLAAVGTFLIVETRLAVLYEKLMPSVTRSDAAGQTPLTSPSFEDLVATVLKSCPWLPEICYRIADIYMTPLQLNGSNPGTKQIPTYFYPVSYRSKTATELLALVDVLNQYTDGYFMANEMKIQGHRPTELDLLPKHPISVFSDYGLWVSSHCPFIDDNAAAESIVTEEADGSSIIYWFEHLGIPNFVDLTPLWCTADANRTNADWHCLDVISPGNNILGVHSYQEDATSLVALAEDSVLACFFQNASLAVVAAASGTLNWWAYYCPYVNYYSAVVGSETAWNAKMDGCMFQLLFSSISITASVMGDILPEIRSVEQARSMVARSHEAHTYTANTGTGAGQQSGSGNTTGGNKGSGNRRNGGSGKR